MAPQVQSLGDVLAELNPAYAAQESVIQKKQAGLGAKYDAQRAGINAERGQGFAAINNQATGRGMSFSGIPIDEQATYLSTKYLPGMQMANYQQNEEGIEFEGQLAQIGTQKHNQAFGVVQQQRQDLNQWNQNERSIAASAEQARLQREFQERQAAADRAFQGSQNAANRAASAAANAPRQLNPYEAAMGFISNGLGADGFVSPGTFRMARDEYVQAGGKASDFATQFWKYTGVNGADGKANAGKNGSNWKSYYYG